jgi:hypothetical protein
MPALRPDDSGRREFLTCPPDPATADAFAEAGRMSRHDQQSLFGENPLMLPKIRRVEAT